MLHSAFTTKRLHVLACDAVPAVGLLAVVAGPALLLLLVDGTLLGLGQLPHDCVQVGRLACLLHL